MRHATLISLLVLSVASGFLGCHRQPAARNRHLVFLIDVSASIDKQAQEQAFDAVLKTIREANRGDAISIIPITGDAETQAQGRILRLRVPESRSAYDQDLSTFADQTNRSLNALKGAVLSAPGLRTDILGTIHLGQQEFLMDGVSADRVLIILSDFIQDDDTLNFETDPLLKSSATAMVLVARIGNQIIPNHLPCRVFLGLLRSNDLARLDRDRRHAIQDFWVRYFLARGVQPTFARDGPGLMRDFVSSSK